MALLPQAKSLKGGDFQNKPGKREISRFIERLGRFAYDMGSDADIRNSVTRILEITLYWTRVKTDIKEHFYLEIYELIAKC